MATLTVGQGQQFSSISAAVAASRDGDVVQVQAGTYTNDFATINSKITLQGVGGMVKLVATGDIPNEKGILVANNDVTIDHFEFTGAQVSSGNGAGIRYQAGNLVVTNSYFHDNQNGILANPSETGTITIRNSEFNHNGSGDGYTHNIYVNDVAKLTITDSYFHDAVYGHEIKSRASVTEIVNNRIYDNGGDASYSIDLPNGGKATIAGNVIQQGPNSANPNIVAYGAEGDLHGAASQLTMTGNTIINEMPGRGAVLWNAAGSPVTFDGNSIYGANQVVNGDGVSVGNNPTMASVPALDSSSPWSGGGSAPAPALAPAPSQPVQVPGTNGDDVLAAPAEAASFIRGGEGSDAISGNADYFNNVNGNQGDDVIVGRSKVGDWLLGGQGDDSINAQQSIGRNIVNGNLGTDTIAGGSGADTLRGGQGDDFVVGGGGDDWLSGDLGTANVLSGQGGADVFHASDNGAASLITDFAGGDGDRILLDEGVSYQLSQQGTNLHVLLTSGQGGALVLENVSEANFQAGWIV